MAEGAEAFKLKVLNAMTAKSKGVAVRLRSQSPRRGRRPEGQPHYGWFGWLVWLVCSRDSTVRWASEEFGPESRRP